MDSLHLASGVLISQEITYFRKKLGILLLLPQQGVCMYAYRYLITESGYIKVGSMSFSFKDKALLQENGMFYCAEDRFFFSPANPGVCSCCLDITS